MNIVAKGQLLTAFVWSPPSRQLPWWQRQLRLFLQIIVLVIRDLREGMLTLRAMSLVYTTLLSLVPLLAVSFSVLKGFGVHNQVKPLLLNVLAPMGEKGIEIADRIVGFVENMKIGVLGGLGMVMLLYTVIALLQKIESAFNHTWRLRNSRNLAQRFSHYLSTITVGPVLVFSAIGITASLSHSEWLTVLTQWSWIGYIIAFISKLIPYLFIIAAFSFLYILIPNVRVRVASALYGAVIAGVLWESTGRVFASFASGSTNYTAIYSGFAILLLFMIWLYIGWLILLVGASITYYHQNPGSRRLGAKQQTLSARQQEWLSVQVMSLVGQKNLDNTRSPVTINVLSEQTGLQEKQLQPILEHLKNEGYLASPCDEKGEYLPARYLDTMSMAELILSARKIGESPAHSAQPVSDSLTQWDQMQAQNWADLNLRQWIQRQALDSKESR